MIPAEGVTGLRESVGVGLLRERSLDWLRLLLRGWVVSEATRSARRATSACNCWICGSGLAGWVSVETDGVATSMTLSAMSASVEVHRVGGGGENHPDIGWEALEKQRSQEGGVGLSCVIPEELLHTAK